MPIELHGKHREQLLKRIGAIAGDLRRSDGMFLDLSAMDLVRDLDDGLKGKPELASTLARYIGDTPLPTFVTEYLNIRIRDNYDYRPDDNGLVKEMEYYGTQRDLATDIVCAFESLPWSYAATFLLPDTLNCLLDEDEDERSLSEDTRLARLTDHFKAQYSENPRNIRRRPSRAGLTGLLSTHENLNQVSGHRIVLQTKVDGFIGIYDRSVALQLAEQRTKSFFGLLLALGIIEKGSLYGPRVKKNRLTIHQATDEGWEYFREHEFDHDFDELIARVRIADMSAYGVNLSGDALNKICSEVLNVVRTALQPTSTCKRVQLASVWLIDSYANGRDLLAFIQAMVSLEILLEGDYKETGLGAMLRNRCAFLIGTSEKDREDILCQLTRIYQVRSNILHRGKDQLTNEEKRLLYSLRYLTSRVIRKELALAASIYSP
ncbi:hypothetical protein ASD54_04580 [Rhizobium sp. Root149]|jgi:hypothetical protein|uniref:HEPN domain-containing protein n=1 Tax=Rhizobium sp. Root149 TaxID=1736473 RepID=UPI0007135CE5|nr:HEPN domain-containing protein [Rhizobium sp. Root149]KQZ54610.1 hypothetical protein ASD54_04580 [Rhizobium sp. Root149]